MELLVCWPRRGGKWNYLLRKLRRYWEHGTPTVMYTGNFEMLRK